MQKRITAALLSLAIVTAIPAQLPPKIQADKHLIFAEQLYEAKNYAGAFAEIEKIIALQQEHNFDLSDEYHFKYAQIALSVDSTRIALEQVGKYLSATGDAGQHYKEALALLLKAEGHVAEGVGDFYEDVIKVEGTCEGLKRGSSCWQKLDNHAQCYVWNPSLTEGETATWTGTCEDYRPDGEGTLRRYLMGKNTSGKERQVEIEKFEGHLQKGQMWEGEWRQKTYFSADRNNDLAISSSSSAHFVNGKRHGKGEMYEYRVVLDWESKPSPLETSVQKFNYANGKLHGPYLMEEDFKEYRSQTDYEYDKIRVENHYVDGKKHGKEKLFRAKHKWEPSKPKYSLIEESFYIYGVKHGEAKQHGILGFHYVSFPLRTPFMSWVVSGHYVGGERHGQWLRKSVNREENRYTEGNTEGDTERISFVYGKPHGPYYLNSFGVTTEGLYVDDKPHGHWIMRAPYGAVGGGSHVNGKRHGPWVDLGIGRRGKGEYVHGKREGKWMVYTDGKCRDYWYENDRRIEEDGIRKKNCKEAGLMPP